MRQLRDFGRFCRLPKIAFIQNDGLRRANGRAILLARPGGLGHRYNLSLMRAKGPSVFPLSIEINMPQSHSQVWIHIVFSTKHRRPFLQSTDFRDEMFRMLAYHVKQCGCVVGTGGRHVDHVHLLFGFSRTIIISKLIEVIRTETPKWAKKPPAGDPKFARQSG